MNQSRVQAYNSFFEQGMEAYNSGDKIRARSLLLDAAKVADEISVNSPNYSVKMEYHKLAEKLLIFVRANCNKKVAPKKTTTDDDDTARTKVIEAVKESTGVTFADVAGLEDVKEQIRFKVLAPMQNPDLAKKYKIKAGGKILLYGPPGTGKTFIAKAIAGEVDAVFYAVNCQDLISKYMGDSSKQLDSLFIEAQKNKRAIIFFDEFDAVASKRGDGTSGVDAEMARFVATFLTKVDGFSKSKTNEMLLLIAATNRPWAIDTAMLRGGRFDTQVYVSVPDQKAREFLVNKAFKDLPIDKDVSLTALANSLNGYGGGDIVSICEKIALEAYKRAVVNKTTSPVTNADCKKVISNHRNVITQEELEKFDDYSNGLAV